MIEIFKRTLGYLLMIFVFGSTLLYASSPDSVSAWQKVDAILQRIHPPSFPDKKVSVKDYGAVADGQTDCRPAFVAAIRACADAGGGRVLVPAGEYLINGPLHLDDNINLHLEKESVLRFGTNPTDYLVGDKRYNGCVKVRWEGVWCYNYSPLIYAWKAENVALTGKGTIDGQTDKFWSRWYIEKLHAPDREILYQMPLDMTPMEERVFGPGHHLAPGTIEFYHCENVLIEGITTRMPLERTIHPVFCTNVIVRNVTVQPGVEKARNDDGIDPDSCIDVLIENCIVHTYDDGIAVKSGRAREGWPENGGRPTENVVIRNNTFLGGHNGVSAGSDMSGGIRNIFVENCSFGVEEPQWAVFNAKSNCDRGGVIEKIYFRNIEVGTCRHLIRMETDYKNVHYDSIAHPFPPVFRDMIFQDVTCKETLDEAFFIEGLIQEPVRDILLKDITILDAKGPEKQLKYVKDIQWIDVRIKD
ncbi:glycoside hydrolase family 28 protein [candidate division KSB1 bacterium]|nr:glycoside hydrolase family 28 protein [candidate division KSB1 bacterium]